MTRKKIFVCDDHAIIIDGLTLLFEKHPLYELIGSTKNGEVLLESISQLKPDVLILDLNLKEWDGFTLLEKIRKHDRIVKVLILTMYQDEALIQRARELKANAFLPKHVSNEELLAAIESTFQQEFYIAPSLRQQLQQRMLFRDQFVDRLKLTPREIEIIRSIAFGQSSAFIAQQLNVSIHTIETHRKNIFKKLVISNVAELVHFAHENHLI